MSWIALTPAHIEARIAADELEAIESTGGGSGDRLTGVIEQVTALVRAKVSACHKNELGASGTIPEECLYAACSIAKHAIFSSIPNYTGGDIKTRDEEYREANKFLYDVARCDIGITAENDTTVIGADSGSYGGEPRHSF